MSVVVDCKDSVVFKYNGLDIASEWRGQNGITTVTFTPLQSNIGGKRRGTTPVEDCIFERYAEMDGKIDEISFCLGIDYGYSTWPEEDDECIIIDAYADDDLYVYNFYTVYDSNTVFSIVYAQDCRTFMINERQVCIDNKRHVWRKADEDFRNFCMEMGSLYNGLLWICEKGDIGR